MPSRELLIIILWIFPPGGDEMYSEILDFLEGYFPQAVTVENIQTGYLGDFPNIDLRIPAVLMEPKTDKRVNNTTRWDKGDFLIRLWIMVPIDLDYKSSMKRIEKLLSMSDDQWIMTEGDMSIAPNSPNGVLAALKKLKRLDDFSMMEGYMGGVAWRVGEKVCTHNNVTFSIQQRASERINIAQLDLNIHLKIEV